MKRNLLIGALCASFAIAAPSVQAITLTSFNLNGNDNNGVLVDQSILGIDVGLRGFNPASFTFTKGANSLSMYDFSSVIDNLIGSSLGSVSVSLLGGATFSGTGSVTPGFGTIDSISLMPLVDTTRLTVTFGANGEPFGLQVGNPFGELGLADWQVAIGRVLPGDTFSVVIEATPIPVPGALVMMLSGLLGFGVLARRKKAA